MLTGMNDLLAATLDRLPTDAGCYLFRDAVGRLLYVGKASNLRNRVRSYFRQDVAGAFSTRAMVRLVASVETIITANDIEALALENNLIKRNRPHFNIRLRDDSTYPFIKLTRYEAFPRLLIVRRRLNDGAKYFGPFPDAGAMRATLNLIGRLFPLRKKRTPPFKNRPCLNYDIGRCLAPCQNLISKADYDRMVTDVENFLEGRHQGLLKRLEKDMAEASEKQDYERAAKLRDMVRSVERVMERQLVVGEGEEDYDALAVAIKGNLVCVEIFQVREGKVVLRREHQLDLPAGDEQAFSIVPQAIAAFISQYYPEAEVPPEILVPALPENVEIIEALLSKRRGTRVRLHLPQRGGRRKLLDMVQANAVQGVERLALSKAVAAERDPSRALTDLAAAIGMEALPERIEGFDISHIQGTDSVASMVVFVGGQPFKADYRKFRIRSATGGDDFASMHEVVKRHYRRLLAEGADLPDLILIDGGKGQLGAAKSALDELGIKDQPIFGLAKRLEEIFLPGREEAVLLAKDAPALFVIQRVRDEAHRFAVGYHRTLRGKHMTESALDGIPGVGESRKRALLARVGSIDAIRKLDPAELAARGGVPRTVAEAVLKHLAPVTDG